MMAAQAGVEEDPSSQFVDFTNATGLEQLIADVEQTLLAWHLANQGHASAAALAATTSAVVGPFDGHAVSGSTSAYTRVLELHGPPTMLSTSAAGGGASSSATSSSSSATGDHVAHYALTLLLPFSVPSSTSSPVPSASVLSPSSPSSASSSSSSSSSVTTSGPPKINGRQWPAGREHFTPTMLAIADASRDLVALGADDVVVDGSGPGPFGGGGGGGAGGAGPAAAVGAGAGTACDVVGPRTADDPAWLAAAARTWFGVDSFLLITRTSVAPVHRSDPRRLGRQQPPPSSSSRSEPPPSTIDASAAAVAAPAVGATLGAFVDGLMDPDEAHLVLSAVHLALQSCNCTIPVFAPIQDLARGHWLGSAVPGSTGNVAVSFETEAVPEVNSHQSGCISGLVDFFQRKLQLPPAVEDQCRLAPGTAAPGQGDTDDGALLLRLGTWASAAFRYTWRRDDDPRELERGGASALAWRYGVSSAPEPPSTALASDALHRALFGVRPPAGPGHVWGPGSSPVLAMDLTAVWANLREGTYVDNAVHSTLDPQTAPEWLLRVHLESPRPRPHAALDPKTRKPTMPLSRLVANLLQAYAKSRDLNRDVLVCELAPNVPSAPFTSSGGAVTPPISSSSSSSGAASTTAQSATTSEPPPAPVSSSRLPDTIPAARAAAVLGSAIGSITSSIVSVATWKGTDVEEIRRIIAEIFDADAASTTTRPLDQPPNLRFPVVPASSSVKHTAPVGGLVSILACRMGQLHGIHAMALLWVEFVRALRERWFQQQLLPLLRTSNEAADGLDHVTQSLDAMFLLDSSNASVPSPDFHQCLLHQKLQLLNCCIVRQADITRSAEYDSLKRTKKSPTSASNAVAIGTGMSDLTSFQLDDDDQESLSDDEFFDSVEHNEDSKRQLGSSTAVPEGVRRPVPNMRSLTSRSPVMEPITQSAVPLTEDVAKEQQELLARLGVTNESAMLRQQIQSGALVSDMQAFKAANPGCCLGDFIRWYSPKDWVPFLDESSERSLPLDGRGVWWFPGEGMLSDRMRPGNLTHSSQSHVWHRMWETSPAIPVSKQRCLFDPIGESEKLYHYFETMSPHELFHQMLAGAIASCYHVLESTALPFPTASVPVLHDALAHLRQLCDRAVSLLDDALAESQVVVLPGRDQREDLERAKGQLQVAFEMALDGCWKMAQAFENVEMLTSQVSALLQYFESGCEHTVPSKKSLELVNHLLLRLTHHHPGNSVDRERAISTLLNDKALRSRISALILHNPSSRDPIQREYILRCICPRPFLDECQWLERPTEDDDSDEDHFKDTPKFRADDPGTSTLDVLDESPVVVNRMYASFTRHTVRFALTLADSEF